MQSNAQQFLPIQFTRYGISCLCIALIWLSAAGCQKTTRDRTAMISQHLTEAKTKTDDLRKAMQLLTRMSPSNSYNMSKDIQKELNTWLETVDSGRANYTRPKLLQKLPSDLLAQVGGANPDQLQFDARDADYLYECRLMQMLSQWVTEFPLRDNLLLPILESSSKALDPADELRLMEAYKLFDWTHRNIALAGEASSSVETMTRDARPPIDDSGIGYGYLPWETLLFSRGDFVERGRVFCALARQRGIDTCWISVGSAPEAAGNLFAIAVCIGKQVYLFEPKLGLPIIEPDTLELATLQQVAENPRILRRLDLAGQFDYAFEADEMRSLQWLIDVPPVAATARMKLLEESLTGDERMQVFVDLDALQQRLSSLAADAHVTLWWTPLLAQMQAASVRERLQDLSQFTLQYNTQHSVWLMKTPAAEGRLLHLAGDFENTLEKRGALATYMDTRIDDVSIGRLAYDPQVQKELGAGRRDNESKEAYEERVMQMQFIFGRAKLDTAYMLAQLHFDRGNYEAAENWMKKRVLDVEQAAQWHSTGWYTLARTYQELGQLEQAEEALTHLPTSQELNPLEPGNRLRLRLLRQQGEKVSPE
ncbi:MAG: CDC27 family protein [Pirellulaceae bacterium]